MTIEPFTSHTSDRELEDLRDRLRRTRWPAEPLAADWALGTDVAFLRDLVAYWHDGFDWPAVEAGLNALPRYRVTVGGLGVHVVHARAETSAGAALPLLLCHGWPDSFWRYLKVLPLLTDPGAHGGDPADAFDVVIPDMPGFGWSDHPVGRAPSSLDVAHLWADLMTQLGYDRFAAAVGDIGSHVVRFLALEHPSRVIAAHRTDGGLPYYAGDPADLTDAERAWMRDAMAWGAAEGAYAAVHRTKPQTQALALTDSPTGLASWIVEKLRAWSDCGGDLFSAISRDDVLTNITIYWLTRTIGPSMRMYQANAAIPAEQLSRHVDVPSGFSIFQGDVVRPPRAWLERTTNLVSATEPARGGHFAAIEQPELYAEELRAFFRPFRTRG